MTESKKVELNEIQIADFKETMNNLSKEIKDEIMLSDMTSKVIEDKIEENIKKNQLFLNEISKVGKYEIYLSEEKIGNLENKGKEMIFQMNTETPNKLKEWQNIFKIIDKTVKETEKFTINFKNSLNEDLMLINDKKKKTRAVLLPEFISENRTENLTKFLKSCETIPQEFLCMIDNTRFVKRGPNNQEISCKSFCFGNENHIYELYLNTKQNPVLLQYGYGKEIENNNLSLSEALALDLSKQLNSVFGEENAIKKKADTFFEDILSNEGIKFIIDGDFSESLELKEFEKKNIKEIVNCLNVYNDFEDAFYLHGNRLSVENTGNALQLAQNFNIPIKDLEKNILIQNNGNEIYFDNRLKVDEPSKVIKKIASIAKNEEFSNFKGKPLVIDSGKYSIKITPSERKLEFLSTPKMNENQINDLKEKTAKKFGFSEVIVNNFEPIKPSGDGQEDGNQKKNTNIR